MDDFFNMIVLKLNDTTEPGKRYVLERWKDEILFFSEDSCCHERIVVSDDSQLKDYYDRLGQIYGEGFNELTIFGEPFANLYAIINKHNVLCVKSDNNCDFWITDKIYRPINRPKK